MLKYSYQPEGIKIARIFIIEDDPDIIFLFEELLKRGGHNVVGKAFNGKEALDKYKILNPAPDIILMDHRMPYKNGLDTTKEILEFDPQAKIFFVSADSSIKKQALSTGAVIFLGKPIRSASLLKEIEEYLNSSKILEQIV